MPARRNGDGWQAWGGLAARVLAVFALACAVWYAWGNTPALDLKARFPFHYVRVQGEIENLNPERLHEVLLPALEGGYFFQDLGVVESAVRTLPWVDQVRLTKVWPDTLEVDITEQKPVARWGDRALLNLKGERFTPNGIEEFTFLPVIYGQLGMESQLLEVLAALNDRLAAKGLAVVSMDLSKRRAWIVRLDNGLELHFGRQDPVQLLERFLSLTPKLGDEVLAQLKRVDLRYPNGFAVVWKSPEEINNAPTGAGLPINEDARGVAQENQQ